MKIYNKRGLLNIREKKLQKALTEYFEKNPEAAEGFQTANSFEELKSYHDKYCIEEVSFTETRNDGTVTDHVKEEDHKNFRDSLDAEEDFASQDDPMNRESPKIREYVLEDGFKNEGEPKETPQSNYDEPKSFRESFDIPNEDISSDKPGNQGPNQPLNAQPRAKASQTPVDPDAKIKRKSTKKFTKYAVDAACALAGRGIVWYTTKDITNEKIQQYIIDDEISKASLDLIVFLDHSTKGSVKQFFELTVVKAQDLANFTTEEKEDLVEAFNDFLEYKKIEINPVINLGTVFLGMLFDRALGAMQMKAEASSILSQLKNMHQNTEDMQEDPAGDPETESKQDPAGESMPDEAQQTEKAAE